MRKIREVLRLRLECRLSLEQIGLALGLSKGVVAKYVKAAAAAQLDWPAVQGLAERGLEERLFPPAAKVRFSDFTPPDYAWIHQELKRKGVTLQLLWEEYRAQCPGRPYLYTAFTQRYRTWAQTLKRSMRQVHRAGEKLFIDYAGQTTPVIDGDTGQIHQAQLFVATMGASNYTYAEATWGQKSEDWLGAQARALTFLGGVPAMLVPDNPRALIADPDRYEPGLGRAYQEFAAHYGVAVLPARVRHPQDKAKVEVAVQIAERWILARLRHRQFFSLTSLNGAIGELLADFNHRPFKKLSGCRASAFAALDRPMLRPLPARPFELARWKKARVSIDYHVEIERHYYSVPFQLVGKQVEVRLTAAVIECFLKGERVASHPRSTAQGRHSTVTEHMPKSHRAHLEWSPGRLLNWGASIGPATAGLVKHLLESRPHPEMGYRACLGLMRLGRTYGNDRLEAACARAMAVRAPTYRSVASILKAALDRLPLPTPAVHTELRLPEHDNVRGPKYYH